ncbi:hypothetical protein M427DRAFT_72256 [Gonapodya prolifera JEL478]|uniref:F-box domain-containing protein n=1 Tax=Gonapodya prolifera (strain JEL478) TaxID=1344416 RepID=A0A139A5W3_GONPJ|nr:hypothetical protein M427DRAFT_72256 [Gonapodya prolifera JEL478]|eukprot:KXS12144.1 hypothetical protein M427DRAFT_72256 [Gonapodya prolifera JEL478]
MDDLPTEILRQIFRLLPPRTFYGKIPLLSRTMREVARSALPGCPNGEVGVKWDNLIISNEEGIELVDEFDSALDLEEGEPERFTLERRFESIERNGHVTWTAARAVVTWDGRPAADISPSGLDLLCRERICEGFRIMSTTPVVFVHDALVVGGSGNGFEWMVQRQAKFAAALMTQCEPRRVKLPGLVFLEEFYIFDGSASTLQTIFPSVVELHLESVVSGHDDYVARTMSFLLLKFPNASFLVADEFTITDTITNSIIQSTSLERRLRVTHVWETKNDWIAANGPVPIRDLGKHDSNLLVLGEVFPNISALGRIPLLDFSPMVQNIHLHFWNNAYNLAEWDHAKFPDYSDPFGLAVPKVADGIIKAAKAHGCKLATSTYLRSGDWLDLGQI